MKLHIGHGGHMLDGWQNLEQHQCDITKPLDFKNDSADFILIEHVLEHVTPQQSYRFLLESHRILRSEGVIRVVVPDIRKVWMLANTEYLSLLKDGIKTWWPAGMWKDAPPDDYQPTKKDAVETLIFCHGHQAIYTQSLLETLVSAVGFRAVPCQYRKSKHPELDGVDSHWKYMGLENCILESCVVEGTK